MSATVHWRRNSSGGRCGSLSGVRALWNAYRWLLNITPGGPNAFFSSKLNMCATPSNTNTSSIMADHLSRARGQPGKRRGRGPVRAAAETAAAARLWGQPVGGPRLVPDDLDLGIGHAGLRLHPLLDLTEHPGRERASAGGQQQLDPDVAIGGVDRAHQAHVHDRDPLFVTAGVIYIAECIKGPLRHGGHAAIVRSPRRPPEASDFSHTERLSRP